MFSFDAYLNLPLVWAVIIVIAVLMYVLLDGFDLGIGILFPFAPSDDCRNKMMNSIAPFWDGNETWLVMGGGGMFAAFPLAYSVIMPALYIPILFMLLALIFRGVAFEFRFKSGARDRKLWDLAFHFGSLFATFMQGMILGGIVQGINVVDKSFAGSAFDWLSGFSFLTGMALVCGYVLLGSTWLYMKTSDETQIWAHKTIQYILLFVLFFMGLVSIWMPFIDNTIFLRWFSWPNVLYLWVVPALILASVITIYYCLQIKQELYPFLLSLFIFFLGFVGLLINVYPHIVPYAITLEQAAAAAESLSLMLVGVVFILPVILFYTGYCYYVFRGKAKADHMY
jgi:cytochrome d ubiquinol oxidase subunit II